MLAGIWQEAEYKGERRIAFAILTDEPNELVASYHDRMPLALADGKVTAWLDPSQDPPLRKNLLLDLNELTVRRMDRAVNNVRQKSVAAIDPEAGAGIGADLHGASKNFATQASFGPTGRQV
jgi:putative SOS response-associated peptidase YedK